MDKILYDVECYTNCFLCSIENFKTGKKHIWEISEHKNDFKKIQKFFLNFDGFLVSFNGIHYDNCMIMWVLYNGGKGDVKEFLQGVKNWSDKVINTEYWWNDQKLKKYKYHNMKWTDVDLFLYWSKSTRMSKKISLKGLGIQLGYPVVQELPFDISWHLNREQIDELIHYNSVHDLGLLRLLLIKMEDLVKLRVYVKKNYGINCMSMDAPKIASEVLLDTFCKSNGMSKKEARGLRFERGTKLELPNIEFKTKEFQKLYKDMCNTTDSFSDEIVLNLNKTSIKISYGIGGIHSVNKNEIYKEDEENDIVTSDVTSLYPNLIVNYQAIRFPIILEKYKEVKEDRIIAKKEGLKTKDEFLKLILNSISGLIDMAYGWLYYPEGAMKMRLMGQLIMTKTVEELAINNFKVLSVNTDGVEVIVPKLRKEEYYNIVNRVGEEFNLNFEHESYKQIIYQNVNSYIAETYNLKKPLKLKGLFKNPDLGDSVNFLVIPKSIIEYFINGTPVDKFIRSHNEIFDFCASKKVDKSYTVMWTNTDGVKSKQQRLNRFYTSVKGGYLMKQRTTHKGFSESHLLKDSGVQLYNNHNDKEFPLDINYSFYIKSALTIIEELKNFNQLKLF